MNFSAELFVSSLSAYITEKRLVNEERPFIKYGIYRIRTLIKRGGGKNTIPMFSENVVWFHDPFRLHNLQSITKAFKSCVVLKILDELMKDTVE